MSWVFQAASAAKVTGAGVSSTSITWPGSPNYQLLIAVFGFEGVNTTDGPWITGTPFSTGWKRATFQPPSVNGGSGLEIWIGSPWTSGALTNFSFTGNLTFVGRGLVYSGEYYAVSGDNAALRSAQTAQVVGNNPASPNSFAYQGDMALAVAADSLQAGGYGNPTTAGWGTARFDDARGAAGTVEITASDQLNLSANGFTGSALWGATATNPGTAGATAVLVFIPLSGTTPQAAIIDAPMPEYLDIGSGYTIRVTAVDPATGSTLSTVNIGTVVFTTDQIAGSPEGLQAGPFMLVPGPNA